MLLGENFLEIFVQANQASAKFAGQLFTHDAKTNKIQTLHSGARKGFKARSMFLFIIAVVMLVRFVDDNYHTENGTDNGTRKKAKQNMYILMFFLCIVVGERYRIRAEFPQDYASFLNGAIEIEKTYSRGKD